MHLPAAPGRHPRRPFPRPPPGYAPHTPPARTERTAVPRSPLPDATLPFLRDPYGYIGRECDRRDADGFRTRLLGRPAVCLRGEDASRLFYDEKRFRRADAAPRRLRKTLFGEGGVQGLDDAAHRHRKALFTALLSPAEAERLAADARRRWGGRIARWRDAGDVVLRDEVAEIHCEAVCAWAGVPLPAGDVATRTRWMTAMIEAPAAIGPAYLRGRLARIRAERWAAGLVRRARRGRIPAPSGSALRAIAAHRDPAGRALSPRVAAVELLNVIRPAVAVSRYVVLSALALAEAGPGAPPPADLGAFAQEVRRRAPFFPVVAARARRDFTWRDLRFREGERVLLDLHGTNHDPRLWPQPDRLVPGRFAAGRDPGPHRLIPQGGGDPATGHRCPGEPVTLALMRVSLEALTRDMDYEVPPQDLRLRGRAPVAPASGFVVRAVRPRTENCAPT